MMNITEIRPGTLLCAPIRPLFHLPRMISRQVQCSTRSAFFANRKVQIFFLYIVINLCCGAQQKYMLWVLIRSVLPGVMGNHNVCFLGEIRK